ncbi:tyrosine-type recombinase/integrase [Mycobacterium sp. NPDC003449]
MEDALLSMEQWLLILRGERKSPETLKAYRRGVTEWVTFAEANDMELDKASCQAWVASMYDREAATVRLRLAAVKRFAAWVTEDGEADLSTVALVKAPKLDDRVVPHLADREVAAMLKASEGKEFRDRRDYALILMFAATGARASEMLAVDVDDVSLADSSMTVRRGKGARGRRVRFTPEAAAALVHYLRARKRLGSTSDALWLSAHGRLSYTGLVKALKSRAEQAGVPGFHIHRLRHTFAVKWLRESGSEGGLMAQAGWRGRKQLDRYVASAAEELSSDEYDRLNIRYES